MNIDKQKSLAWLKTAAMAAVGGGIAAAITAGMDPSKYHFPHDFGSGKLLEYFGEGFAVTFGALLIRSPLGQQVMTAYKDTQGQLAQSKAEIAQAKEEIKPPAGESK